MPTNRTRRTRNIFQELTEDQLNSLIHGWTLDNQNHPFFSLHGDSQFPFKDDAHRRELYFKHKDYLFSLAGKGLVDGLYGELAFDKKPSAFFDYESVKTQAGIMEAEAGNAHQSK